MNGRLLIPGRTRKDAEINGNVIRPHADARGESANGFILRSIIETMERDNAEATADKES